MSTWTLLPTDAQTGAAQLAPGSVDLLLTSPPYYNLRAYGTDPLVWGGNPTCEHQWTRPIRGQKRHPRLDHSGNTRHATRGTQGSTAAAGFTPSGQTCVHCTAWLGELGQEPTPDLYVAHLVQVLTTWRGVLAPSGVLLLNLGDSYTNAGHSNRGRARAHSGGKAHYTPTGALGKKQLLGIPWRVAQALQAEGWIWRGWWPWMKDNAMPESVADRPTMAQEVWLLFAARDRYYWDGEAIRQPSTSETPSGNGYARPERLSYQDPTGAAKGNNEPWQLQPTRHYRTSDAWRASVAARITALREELALLEATQERGVLVDPDGLPVAHQQPTRPYPGAHFATFSVPLVEPYILAGCPPQVCSQCSTPYRRQVDITPRYTNVRQNRNQARGMGQLDSSYWRPADRADRGWAPGCRCDAPARPGRVADPFAGTATTGIAALKHNRAFVGCEPVPANYAQAVSRLQIGPLPEEVEALLLALDSVPLQLALALGEGAA